MTGRAGRIVGAAFVLAGIAVLVAAERASRIESLPVDDAHPAERVELHGGTLDCAAAVRADVALTVDGLVWVPYRGARRTVLVGFDALPAVCEGLAVPVGKLVRMQEPAYETLREHDPTRWASVPQATLSLLFPGSAARPRLPLAAAALLGMAGLVVLARSLGSRSG